MKKVIVLGGGLGGLSSAIRLASAGYEVTLIEKQPSLGGKLQCYTEKGYTFDLGPSTITMPSSFGDVFRAAGRHIEDYLTFYPITPLTRNTFSDGSIVDLVPDDAQMEDQIAQYSPEDAKAYKSFMQQAGKMYETAQEQFLNRLLLTWKDKMDPALMRGFANIRPFTSLQSLLKKHFQHPNTLAMFGRYATYVGSDPSKSPAIFSMLAHLEKEGTILGVKGGTYTIVRAFEQLANELGVTIHKNTEATRIVVQGKKVVGVETTDGDFKADTVVANGDVLTVYNNLIDESDRPSFSQRKIESYEPSLSGFVTLVGIPRKYPGLVHHNVFFPEQYEKEFDDIFHKKIPPKDPTLYICNSSHSDFDVADKGSSNPFILANASYLSSSWDWNEETTAIYRDRILDKLEQVGLDGIKEKAEVLSTYTPEDLQKDTYAHRGAIYGISSNGFQQTFFRPSNRAKDIEGLWFAGGTTHPGGGTPIVTLCGRLVAEKIIEEDGSHQVKGVY